MRAAGCARVTPKKARTDELEVIQLDLHHVLALARLVQLLQPLVELAQRLLLVDARRLKAVRLVRATPGAGAWPMDLGHRVRAACSAPRGVSVRARLLFFLPARRGGGW